MVAAGISDLERCQELARGLVRSVSTLEKTVKALWRRPPRAYLHESFRHVFSGALNFDPALGRLEDYVHLLTVLF
jgi:hypothetical protein